MRAPFYGRGIGFPFRINPATGGIQVTEGSDDLVQVGLEFVMESNTIREPLPSRDNHIAESIGHILHVRPGEHDTLPEFGSRANAIIFDPNTEQSEVEFEVWASESTKRWEKRARISEKGGVVFSTQSRDRDLGVSYCRISPEFIRTQVPGNLVTPFVDSRSARSQEYPLGDSDAAGHDWISRYHGFHVYADADGEQFIRPRFAGDYGPRPDDVFYEVAHGDTWLLISHKVYGDIRFHWIIQDAYVWDAADAGRGRDNADTTGDPIPGELLRMPSRTRALMEITV